MKDTSNICMIYITPQHTQEMESSKSHTTPPFDVHHSSSFKLIYGHKLLGLPFCILEKLVTPGDGVEQKRERIDITRGNTDDVEIGFREGQRGVKGTYTL